MMMQTDPGISVGMLWTATGVVLTAFALSGKLIADKIKSAVESANSRQSEQFRRELDNRDEKLRAGTEVRDKDLHAVMVSKEGLRVVDMHIGMLEKKVDELYTYTHTFVHDTNKLMQACTIAMERVSRIEGQLDSLEAAVRKLPH